MIPFNKPYLSGKEIYYIKDALAQGQLSGNGKYTKLCQGFLNLKYGFQKSLLTTSCTDAIEMSSLLLKIQPGDEVIMPSYSFVSTANAFVLRGAKIVFVDSRKDHPGLDESQIESLITPKTKAIVPVHYAGVACDMDKIMQLAQTYKLWVVEDAAHAIDSYYLSDKNGKIALGSIGHLATYSFHETKNIIAGEGGLLMINDEKFKNRAEIIWEKGTNRAAFFRGEVNKYQWMDLGSSYAPSELNAAFLWGQIENLKDIQAQRLHIWHKYNNALKVIEKKGIRLPYIPKYATNNAHMFYLICQDVKQRQSLISHLRKKGIKAISHYISLHSSPFYKDRHDGRPLNQSDHYTDCLLRLPFYYKLTNKKIDKIIDALLHYNNL